MQCQRLNPPRGLLNDRNAPKIIEPVTGSSGIYDVRILPVTALVEFKPNFYDLLLIDVNMPLMDGFQLAQNLLRRDLNARVCFITAGEINMNAAKRSASTQEYRMLHQEANFCRTVDKTH